MDYNVLRRLVANCIEGRSNNPQFKLNTFRLIKKVEPLGLIPIVWKEEYLSEYVTPDDIPLLMEYFKEDKVMWFDSTKTYLTVTFIRAEDMDKKLQQLMHDVLDAKLRAPEKLPDGVKPITEPKVNSDNHYKQYDLPVRDIVKTVAEIVGNYPCLNCVIGKWVKPDKISLNIRFRANSLLISATEKDSEDEKE